MYVCGGMCVYVCVAGQFMFMLIVSYRIFKILDIIFFVAQYDLHNLRGNRSLTS